jgi:hypothetical protein
VAHWVGGCRDATPSLPSRPLARPRSDALEAIFQFYATSDKRTGKALAAHAVSSGEGEVVVVVGWWGCCGWPVRTCVAAPTRAGSVSGPFGAAGPLTLTGHSPGRTLRAANSMKDVSAALRVLTVCSLCERAVGMHHAALGASAPRWS